MEVLRLTLKKEWFEVMVTGEKDVEVRDKSKWIESRLFDKEGNPRTYDCVSFTNGYGKDKPNFVCEFDGVSTWDGMNCTFSNGQKLQWSGSKYVISLGKILSISNYK